MSDAKKSNPNPNLSRNKYKLKSLFFIYLHSFVLLTHLCTTPALCRCSTASTSCRMYFCVSLSSRRFLS